MPTIAIHDALTGETVEREMNEDEVAQYQVDCANAPAYPEGEKFE